MIPTLAWKEYREQRGLWLAIACLAVLLAVNISLLAKGGLVGAHNDWFVHQTVIGLLFALMVAQGIVSGSQLLAGEKEPRTLDFLDTLSSLRLPLWRTKLLVGTLFTLAQALILFVIIFALQMGSWEYLLSLVVVGWFALCWGLMGGAIGEKVFPAILIGIVLGVGNLGLIYLMPNWAIAIIAYLMFPLVALSISNKVFCRADRQRTMRQEILPPSRWQWLRPWLVLVWLAEKQGRWLIWPGLGVCFIAGIGLFPAREIFWTIATLVIGLVCGLASFAPEQSGEQERFLGAQRFPPGQVWLIKSVFWMLVATGMTALVAAGIYLRRDLLLRSVPLFGFYIRESLPLFLTMWVFHGFCIGQFCSFLSRKIVVTAVLATGGSLIVLLLWLPSLIFGGVDGWRLLTVPLFLLLASRLSMWTWFSTRLYSRRHLFGLIGCALITGILMGANLWHRAVEIPDVGEPFDLKAFEAKLGRASRSPGPSLIRQGAAELESQTVIVLEQLGPPTKFAFPKPLDDTPPLYKGERSYWRICHEILKNGWPPQDSEINRWLDALFAGGWAQAIRSAAQMPLGLMVDPRKFHWIAVEENGRESWKASEQLVDYSKIGLLFASRALQLQARGDDRAALDHLIVLLGLSRQIHHCVPSSTFWHGELSLETPARLAFDQWMHKVGPNPELLQTGLKAWQRHEKESSGLKDAFKADYVGLRNHPSGFWGLAGNSNPEAVVVNLALASPWERERHLRFLNAMYLTQLRLAQLPIAELGFYLNARMRLDLLSDTGWTPQQWSRLIEKTRPFHMPSIQTWVSEKTQGNFGLRELRLALMLFQAEEGHVAAKLDDLVPRYLEKLPVNPWSGLPFDYQISQGEIVYGDFPIGPSPRLEVLRPGQGFLWFSLPPGPRLRRHYGNSGDFEVFVVSSIGAMSAPFGGGPFCCPWAILPARNYRHGIDSGTYYCPLPLWKKD